MPSPQTFLVWGLFCYPIRAVYAYSMATKKTDKDVPSDTPEPKNKVEDWRMTELIRYGFSEYQAAVLTAASGINIADIRERYLNKGCSPEQAWRILEP